MIIETIFWETLALGFEVSNLGTATLSPDMAVRLERLFKEEGVALDGNGFVRTAVTAPAFSYVRPIDAGVKVWWT